MAILLPKDPVPWTNLIIDPTWKQSRKHDWHPCRRGFMNTLFGNTFSAR